MHRKLEAHMYLSLPLYDIQVKYECFQLKGKWYEIQK